MTAPDGPTGASDAELVERVLAADRAAFAEVYDRYGGRLFDFAYAMLRHRDDASDAVADSFVLFAQKLPQLRDPERLRPWLYAITRSECLRRLKARKREAYGADEQLIAMPDEGLTPDRYAEQAALRDLVWDAAAGLADRDRALLDLHLRQGLDGAELGEAMGTTAANAYVMLSRLRTQVERSLGALLIARMGRDDCPDLSGTLRDWDGAFSVLVRKRVARHIDGCALCAVLRRKLVSPWALLATVPPFVAPVALRDRVLDIQLVAWTAPVGPATAGVGGVGPGAVGPGAAPPADDPDRRRGGWLADARLTAVVGAVLLLLLLGTLLRWSLTETDEEARLSADVGVAVRPTLSPLPAGSPRPSSSPSSSPSVTPSATATPTTSIAPAPPVLTVSTSAIDLGRRSTSSSFTIGNSGGSVLSWTASSSAGWLDLSAASGSLAGAATTPLGITVDRSRLPEGRSTATVVVSGAGQRRTVTITVVEERAPVVGPPSTGPSPSCEVTVTASVRDESGLSAVTLHWSGPGGAGTAAMSGFGSTWSAQIGPISTGGSYTMYVVAHDTRGNTGTGPTRTVYLNPCPG